jgi:hypothetical protein
MIRRLINRRLYKYQATTWLHVIPPAVINRGPDSNEHLFSVLHGLLSSRKLKDRLLNRSPKFSFEITSSKKDGIRYLINIATEYADYLEKTIVSYVPEVKVVRIPKPEVIYYHVIEMKQTGHFIFPLTLPTAYDKHDPLSYVTGALANLNDNESLALQLMAVPIKHKNANKYARKILSQEDLLPTKSSRSATIFNSLSDALGRLSLGIVDLISEIASGGSHQSRTHMNDNLTFNKQVAKRQRPARMLSAFESELMESMHIKVNQPLYKVNIRIMASGTNAKKYAANLISALDGYSVPIYQALKKKKGLLVQYNYRCYLANSRLPSLFCQSSMILSTMELASLYHFPSSHVGKTDNLVSSLSRTLPAPISLKSGEKLSVIIGENRHHGVNTLIGLTEVERERHMYIVGGTGSGKTTMLQYMIVQDMVSGKGLAVVDPHGDMAETLLGHVPDNRIDDVIYLNPDDLSHPIGINILELEEGLSGDDLLREKDLITESTISVLRKIFSEDDTGGHRIEYILRNAIQTALTTESPTLFTIYNLLNDKKYRSKIVKTLGDKNLKNFWDFEIGKAGDFQKVKMASGITAKIGRFLFSASVDRVMNQKKSTIDFEKILDEGKILICNFSKGLLGEDTSSLFGTIVLAKLQLASLRRSRTKELHRRPFYLYVDEFQNFATMSFVQMLSEARKYKLFLIMAEQSTAQQDQSRMVDIILANVGTIVCFKSGSPFDERTLLPLFKPFINEGEISNLPAYSYYVKSSAVHSQEPMSGSTLLLDNDSSQKILESVIKESRRKYSVKKQKESKTQSIIKPITSVDKIDD